MIKRLTCCDAESPYLSNRAVSCRNARMNRAHCQSTRWTICGTTAAVRPAAAARRHGRIHPALYYSLGEFYNPAIGRPMRNFYTGQEIPLAGYKPVNDYVRVFELKQLREIIDRYDPDLLWADGQ